MRNALTASPVLHLAHPHPVAWSTLFTAASHELSGLPLVPYAEWVDRLTKSADGLGTVTTVQQAENNPALRIIDFFQAAGALTDEGREAMGLRRLALDRACSASPTLSGLKDKPLDGDNVRSWITYWRDAGFL